jgi:tetratricopeptide (TPR) repeat protein
MMGFHEQRSRKAKVLLHNFLIYLLSIFLVLTFFFAWTHGYYEDSQGNVVKKKAAKHYNKGNDYFEKGQWDLAISEYTKSIEIDPKHFEPYHYRGIAYRHKGQYDQAISDFTKAIELNPEWANAYYNRGFAYLNKTQYDQAISDCTKAIELNPKLTDAYHYRGVANWYKTQYDQAISDSTKAIELDPKYADAYHNRGLAYSNKGQYDQAISDFTKAIELNPKHAKAYGGRGAAYYEKGQFDRAISDLNEAKKLDPNLKEGVDKAIALITSGQKKAVPKSLPWLSMIRSVENDFDTGLKLFESEDYGGAVEKLTSAIDNIPVADKMYKDSREAMDAGSSVKWESLKSDGILQARAIRGHAYLVLEKYDEAKTDANWVVDYYNKNKCTRKDNEKLCKEAVERGMFVRGAVHQTAGEYKQAIQDYDWVVKNGKMFEWVAYENRGRVYLALEDFKTAYTHFDRLIQEYPTSAEYYAFRCNTGYELLKNTTFEDSQKGKQERRKKLKEISADCKKALEIDPKNELAKETAGNLVGEKAYSEFIERMFKEEEEFRNEFGVGLFEDNKEKATSSKNEFGGETLEKTYKKEDAGSEDVKKDITYFDGNKKKMKTEYFHTDKFANEKGFNRSISYFDATGKRTKAEYFFTDKFISEKGYYKSISYYDSTGKRTKTESFYTDKFASEKGFNKYIFYFDSAGKVIKRESYMDDKLVKKTE